MPDSEQGWNNRNRDQLQKAFQFDGRRCLAMLKSLRVKKKTSVREKIYHSGWCNCSQNGKIPTRSVMGLCCQPTSARRQNSRRRFQEKNHRKCVHKLMVSLISYNGKYVYGNRKMTRPGTKNHGNLISSLYTTGRDFRKNAHICWRRPIKLVTQQFQ